MHRLTVLLCLSLIPWFINAQTIHEEVFLDEQDEKAAAELQDRLDRFRQDPLDVNSASVEDILEIPLLSPLLARAIVNERRTGGPYHSLSELRSRLRIDASLWEIISPYIEVRSRAEKKKTGLSVRIRRQRRLQRVKGESTSAYPGSPWKAYQRIILSSGSAVKGGILVEKDPGEPNKCDHVVGYLHVERIFGHVKLIAGHYRAEFGQGLVLWGPYGLSKGLNPIAPVKTRSDQVTGYAYADENHAHLGFALQVKTRRLGLTALVSSSPVDAVTSGDTAITSFPNSGYHRTRSERESRHRIRERFLGGRIRTSCAFGSIGISAWWNDYSMPFKNPDHPSGHVNFEGRQNHVVGIDYRMTIGRIILCGEVAQSESRGWATLNNAVLDTRKTSLVLSYRRYSPDFHNPHGHGFGSNDLSNQEALYTGWMHRPMPWMKINAYYETVRALWRTYHIPVFTTGNDLFCQLEVKPAASVTMILRTRFRRSEAFEYSKLPSGLRIPTLREKRRFHVRWEMQIQKPHFRIRKRVEVIQVAVPAARSQLSLPPGTQLGFLVTLDLRIHPVPTLDVFLRYTCFDTDTYECRMSQFENDLPGQHSIQSLYLAGTRVYLLVKWKVRTYLRISAKFGSTFHPGVSHWGSGLEQINGHIDQKLGIQLDFKL